ncbi:glycosyltransferase family 32 protein [Paracidovorax avenae]|uniref:glycosyltransferase family 32 protein n=1 Tax=Paracidovorax avenae TaxID=80867 RepID=UPI001AD8381C|nr:capsular polysaccharide synthesis protein [Paracidovorax avenae]
MTLRISAPALRAAYRLVTCLRPRGNARYPGQPQAVLFDGQPGAAPAAASQPIPPRLWTYWDTETADPLVDQCIANWRIHCPDFEVQVVNRRNIGDFVAAGDLPPGFAQLHPTKQSDWVRLYLVRHHGGYWLDATILLTRPLHWMDALRQSRGAEFVGFYLGGYTHDERFPVIESWAFGAPAHAPFVTAWQQEFHHALVTAGTDAYLAQVRGQDDAAARLQGIADPAYLLIHVAAQQVLRRGNAFRLALFKAEDTAFFYQQALRWKWYLLYPRLCLVPAEPAPAPLIKLRGGERRHFSELFARHGGPATGSIWQQACGGAKPARAGDGSAA